MLSPVIKINDFDSISGLVSASLINLDYKKTYKFEFSNINFNVLNGRISTNVPDLEKIEQRSQVDFSFNVKNDEDKFLFCKIYEWDLDMWKEVHISTAVVSEQKIISVDSNLIQIEQPYVGPNDKISVIIKAESEHRYDVRIDKKTFGIKTDKNGVGKLLVNTINAVDYPTYIGKFVKKISCSLIDTVKKEAISSAECEYVPENLYALAATNDPNRPSCVILDPDPVAVFSVNTDAFNAQCFPQPLVGSAFTTSGSNFANTTRLDNSYINCNDGYVSSAKTVVDSSCKIYHQPRMARIAPAVSSEADLRLNSLYGSGSRPINKSEWSSRPIGFVYSSCDADANSENVSVDPCSFTSQEIKKIPRIFLGCTTDATNVKIFGLARGILKAPPAYFHSILVGDPVVSGVFQNGDIVNVVFDLPSGERISKSLEYQLSTYSSLAAFITAFASEISSDENITNAGISVRVYPGKYRIDVYSDTKFNIYAGQVNYVDSTTGNYKTNNKIYIIRDSKYTFDFEITSPVNYDDIKTLLSSGATHMLFLDSQFKGMTVSITQSEDKGTIVLDTCPRVAQTSRSGLGAFVVSEDTNCVHVALISDSRASDDGGTRVTALPFVRNSFNEVVPSSNPVITKFGHVFCQALIDNKWQIFSYFPSLSDSPWLQLTYNGENRNVSACSDSFGNVHLSWETDRYGYTSVQYACIGPSSKLINRLSLSGMISKQFVDELYEKTFTINPLESAVNFVQQSSANISLIPETSLISLVEGAQIGGGSFSIAREFTGYVRIEKDEFDPLIIEHPSAKLDFVEWGLKIEPKVNLGDYCTSYLVHFEQVGTNTAQILSSSFSAKFNGKILRVFASPIDFGSSSEYFRSNRISYPSNSSVTFDRNELVESGSISVDSDETTLDFSFSYLDGSGTGPLEFRVLVEGVKNQSSIEQSNWNRIFSNNGRVSVSEDTAACVECAPSSDCAVATLSVSQDHNGTYFQGQEAEINISAHALCSIGPKSTDKISPIGLGIKDVLESDYMDLIERIGSYSSPWDAFSQPIHYVSEFSGEPGFTQTRQYASKYKDQSNSPIVSFEDNDNRYFPGFFNNSKVQSFTVSINAGFLVGNDVRDISFQHPILALYIDQTDLDSTDLSLGNGSANRANLLPDQGVKIAVNKSRTTIKVSMPADIEVDFSIRVVVSSEQFDYPFEIKDDKKIHGLYSDFLNGFVKSSDDSYLLANNKFTISSTDKRYDEIIPLLGFLKYDDININPNAYSANFNNLTSIIYNVDDIDTTTCSDLVSQGTYRLDDQFNLDGDDAHVHHAYVCVIPERVSFMARNNETLDEYVLRTKSIAGYREAIVKDVYTGYGKVFIINNSISSSSKRTSISLGTTTKISDLPSVDLSGSFRVQVDGNYSRLSEEDKKLLSNWSYPSSDVFYPSSKSHPNYHFMCNVYINDKPILSHNAQVDLGDKTRQWEVGFGSPFGQYPVCRSSDASFLDLMSNKNWSIDYSDIRIGNPRVIVDPRITDASGINVSSVFISKLVPNSDSNVQNESFAQSLIDPGDWVSLEHGSLLIDGWETFNGGAVYVGSYTAYTPSKRSVLLESCMIYNDSSPVSYASYPQYKSRRGRISTGQYGGINQTAGTLKPNEMHQISLTTGIRQVQESYPKLQRSILVQADTSVFTCRHTPGVGEFVGPNSQLDYKTFRSSFIPSSSSFDVHIRNVSENLNNLFSYFPLNTVDYTESYGTDQFTGHEQGDLTKDVIFYVDSSGVLKLYQSYSDAGGLTVDEVELSDPLEIVAVDSRIKYTSETSQNPFCVAVTYSGFLQSFTYDGTEDNIPNFVNQSNLPSAQGFVSVSLGYDHACALKSDGTVVCWGSNVYGQTTVPPGYKFVQVKAGQYFTIGINESGDIIAWGRNNHAQVSPVPSGKFVKIDAGAEHAVGIKFDGTAVSWGRNANTGSLIDPTVKLIDVAACGGNMYSLSTYSGSSSSSSSMGTYNVEPFNVGIDINGNVIKWGLWNDAFTPSGSGREKYHAVPSIPCVAVKHGIKSCLLLGIDGKVYAHGIAFGPSEPGDASNINSVYKTDLDFASGGPFIESVYSYAESDLIEEDVDVEAYRLFGMGSSDAFKQSYGLPLLNSFSSVPLSWQYGDLQKSPSCEVDKFNKCTLIWEDNSQGVWGICESSNIWINRSFSDRIFLSDKEVPSLRPSIASDGAGRRAVVWESISGDSHAIRMASHINHPDYASDCDVDKVVSNSRLLGVDPDPYDPYNVEQSLMSCKVDLSFTAPEFGNYFFSIAFKDLSDVNIIYKQSSSKTESGKWLISGKFISYDGQVIAQGETVTVSYVPDSNDNVFNKVLKVELTYSTEETSGESMLFYDSKSTQVTPGVSWWMDDPFPVTVDYPVSINGSSGTPYLSEYMVFAEAAKNCPVTILPQGAGYFETQGVGKDQNFIFPSGVSSLPGVTAGTFVKSFLFVLGDDNGTTLNPVEATLSFNQPIVAVLIDEENMQFSDGYFTDPLAPINVSRKNVVDTFQFYDGEYMRLDEDRKKLHIRFYQPRKATWPTPLTKVSPKAPPGFVTASPTGTDTPPVAINPVPTASINLGKDEASIVSFSEETLGPLASLENIKPYATFRVIVANTGRVSGQIVTTYFCPAPLRALCKISTSYTNNSSQSKDVHFKVSVYSDSSYKDAIMAFNSKTDARLWSSGSNVFPVNGITISPSATGSVSFAPPIINIQNGQYPIDESSVNTQTRASSIYDYYNLARTSLICGIKYYIIAEATVNNDDIELYRTSFVCGCNDNLFDREDESEWRSVMNSSINTVIASAKWYIGNPSVSATRNGLFAISWEDSRSSANLNGLNNKENQNLDIYCGFFDAINDLVDSAYHSGIDRLLLNNSVADDVSIRDQRLPQLISDPFGNFTMFASKDYNKIIKRYFSVGSKITPNIIVESAITTACSFTLTDINTYQTAFDGGEFMQIRVNDKFIKGYKSIAAAAPAPIVNDCFVDLEIIGIPGAMAYRIKNESESDFTDWIPINLPLQPLDSAGKAISLDAKLFRETFKGRWIANDIFTAPWVLSKADGVKRVCIEILTQFGKTQQFCMDIIAEYASLSYIVEIFYSPIDSNSKLFKPVRYKGIPVVNRKTYYSQATDSQSAVTISKEDLRSLDLDSYTEVGVYVQVTFEDAERIARLDALNSISSYASRRKDNGSMQLSLYQQGNRVQTASLVVSDAVNGIYYGKFNINKNNGVTDKDGLAFVFVDLPSECLNPFVKNFISVLRLINDQNLDMSQAKVVDSNAFIEQYIQNDKRNAFGKRRIN